MNKSTSVIISNPEIMEGKPVIVDTMITVESIIDKLANYETVDGIIAAHPELTKEKIADALTYTNKILKAEPVDPIGLIKLLININILDNKKDKKITFTGHILLTGSLFLLVIISHIIMSLFANSWEGRWLNPPKEENIKLSQLRENKNFAAAETGQQTRLIQQLNTINDLTARHCGIMSFFYKQYYISLSIGSGAALVSLICILFVSKEGWKATNNALINLGTTSFSITLFFLNTSQIFQQAENLNTSQSLYANYLALHNEFRSSLYSNKCSVDTKVKNNNCLNAYDLLIHNTDSRLKELSLIRLGFDPTPILGIKNSVGAIIAIPVSPSPSTAPSTKPTP